MLIFYCLSLSFLGQVDPVYSVTIYLDSYLNENSLREKMHTHTFIFNGQGQLLVQENHLESLVLTDRDIGKNYKYTSYQYQDGKIWKAKTEFIAESGERLPSSTRIFTYKNGRVIEIQEGVNPDSIFNFYTIRYDKEGRKKQVNWLRAAYDTLHQTTDFTHYDTISYSFHWDDLGRCQAYSAPSSIEFSESGKASSLRSYHRGYLDQDFRLIRDEQGRLVSSSFEARSNYQNEEKIFQYSDSDGLLHSVNCRSELFVGGYSAKLQNRTRLNYEFSYSKDFKDLPKQYFPIINKQLSEAFLPKQEEWQIFRP